MNQRYQIFECSPGIPTTEQADGKHQTEDDKIVSTYGNKDDNEITKNG